MKSLLLLALGALAFPAFSQSANWKFENENTWQPRKGITLSRVAGGANAQSQSSLQISGAVDGVWNYALSNAVPVKSGGLYRISAWLRVDQLSPNAPAPFLKCEFTGEGGTSLGRAESEKYNLQKRGAWQHLSGEFKVPAGADKGWLALETGGNMPLQISALLDDVTLDPIAKFSNAPSYELNPVPASLQKIKGVHPRLYLDAAKITHLRGAMHTTHAVLWDEVKAQADKYAQSGPPAYREKDAYSGEEQLYQRDVGNAMPPLALAYMLTRDKKFLDAAKAWALMSCSYPTWGLGKIDGLDLAAGHQLFGLAIVYDWCHADLDEDTRNTIKNTLIKKTSAMFDAAQNGTIWWHKSYLQNHLWVNITGMAAAGFALYGEVPEAAQWIALPLDKFRKTMSYLGPDGASHEGVGYWGYGVEYMMKFNHLAKAYLNEDLYSAAWWKNTASYRQYFALPRAAWTKGNNIVDIADCPRSNWYGPDYLLRGLATRFRDGHAQWLAQQIDDANVDDPSARWLNLIWFDHLLPAQTPNDLPTLRHFEDMGLVSARSSWSGSESLVAFKSGPFIGHEAMEKFAYDPGGGHVQPDANHFVLFGNGEWLIRDDGYRAKWTGQHNTLLIDGKGQIGEGKQWFDGGAALREKALPKVTRAISSPQLDVISGDATSAYFKDSALQRYQRHLLFIKPNILIVLDDIKVDAAKPLELRFHPESKEFQRDGAAFLFKGKTSTLRVQPLTETAAAEEVVGQGRIGENAFSMFTIRQQKNAAAWRNAVAFSWSDANATPPIVDAKTQGDVWQFSTGKGMVSFDWKSGHAQLTNGAQP